MSVVTSQLQSTVKSRSETLVAGALSATALVSTVATAVVAVVSATSASFGLSDEVMGNSVCGGVIAGGFCLLHIYRTCFKGSHVDENDVETSGDCGFGCDSFQTTSTSTGGSSWCVPLLADFYGLEALSGSSECVTESSSYDSKILCIDDDASTIVSDFGDYTSLSLAKSSSSYGTPRSGLCTQSVCGTRLKTLCRQVKY